MKKKLVIMLLLFAAGYTLKAQVPVAAQWHFTGNNIKDPSANHDNPTSVGGVDWVFCVLPTDRKEYIGCGYTSGANSMVNPVIFKLDKLGNLKWIKQVTSAEGSGYQYNWGNFGYLTQVIKTPNGYAATGTAYTSPNPGIRCTILLEIDEDGNYIHDPALFLPSGYMQSFGRSLCIDQDAGSDHSIYIAGGIRSIPVAEYYAYVYKINYATWQLDAYKTLGTAYVPSGPAAGMAGNNLAKIRTRQTSATTHEVYACGYCSGSADDNLQYDITTVDPYDPSLTNYEHVVVRDKDMWLVKLKSDLSVDFEKKYNKATVDYPQSLVYTEVGPYSARGIETATTGLGPGTTATQYLKASVNKDERAYDFTFTSDGNIAMVGLINQVAPLGYGDGNEPKAVQTVNFLDNGTVYAQGGFVDPVRNYYYDEYMDGDGYLLKIDPGSGNPIYSKNISHYSSKDFYPQLFQNGLGNFIISGSSADYNPSDYEQPEEYDALVLETPDAGNPNIGVPDHLWRRGYHAEGKEDGMCVFALAQTADGGFVIGGDNDEDHDNFSISKFAPYCASVKSDFAIDRRATNYGEYYIPSGTVESWPNGTVTNGSNIAARVVVQKGATLIIKDCTIHFASSDHVYDYWKLADAESADGKMIGIVVEPGGKLEVINATLRGMDDCQSSNPEDRYMWDGVVVQGNNTADRNSSQQGTATFTNAAIIDARVGLAVDDGIRHLSEQVQPASTAIPDFESGNYSSRYNLRGWYGGGIVNASNSKWENCRFSVNFQQYAINNSVTSTFDDCSFYGTTAGMADPCFYADENGKRMPPSTFFGDWAVDNIHIQNSSFLCPEQFPAKLWPIGIINIDGGFDLSQNTFDNLSTGVQAIYTPGLSAYPLSVTKNTFTNVGNGLNLANGMDNLTITSNTFNIPGSEITGHPGGILMQGCTGYKVQFNTFNGMFKPIYATYPPSSRGVQVSFGSSWTDYNDKIDNNTFDNLRHPAIALQKNSNQDGSRGLRFKCNDFLKDNSRGIARLSGVAGGTYEAATMKQAQGYCEGSFNSPAGNRFYNIGCNNNNTTTSRERLYADFLVNQNLFYYYTSSPTEPEYNPSSSCITNAYYTLNACFNPIDRNVVCDPSSKDPHKDAPELSKLDEKIAHLSPEGAYYTDLVAQRDGMVTDFARQYGQEKAYDEAATLLKDHGRYAEAIAFHITGRNWALANEVWTLLPQTTEDEQQYAKLIRMAIDLFSAGKSWKDLVGEDKAAVTAWSGQNTYPGFLSNAITELLGINTYGWSYAVEADQSEFSGSGKSTHALASGNADNLLQVYPNPTTGVLHMASSQNGIMTITDIKGIVIATLSITGPKSTLQLPKSLSPGLYYIRFVPVTGNTEIHKLVYNP